MQTAILPAARDEEIATQVKLSKKWNGMSLALFIRSTACAKMLAQVYRTVCRKIIWFFLY